MKPGGVMRALHPNSEGIVLRDGVGIRYERFGQGRPAILLLPTWSIVQSRHWKMQVAYLARYFAVVWFDGRVAGAPAVHRNPPPTPTRSSPRSPWR
jgi:hypothetical protein